MSGPNAPQSDSDRVDGQAANVLAFRPSSKRPDDVPTPPGEQESNVTCRCGDQWLVGGAVVIDAETGSVTGRSCLDWRCASCGEVSDHA